MDKLYDVVIIGNGIIAHSIAFQLSCDDPTLKIAMIGPRNYHGSASMAAGAMLGCYGEVCSLTTKYRPQFEKFKLSQSAKKRWSSWLENINHFLVQPLKTHNGTFIMLNAKSGILDNDNYRAILDTLNQYQEPYEKIDPQDIPGLNPIADSRPLDAIHIPGESSINAHRLLSGLHNIITNLKHIDYIDSKICKIHSNAERITAIDDIDGNHYQAKSFVLAAGAFSQSLIDQIPTLKNRIPQMFYGVGISMLLNVPKVKIHNVIRTPNRSFACGLHVVPHDQHSLYLGSTNNVNSFAEYSPKPAQLHFLLQCLLQQIDQDYHQSSILKMQVGNRPVSFDTFPILGNTSLDNLVIACGTYRDGILLSPLIADYISKLLITNKEIISHPFHCERPPIVAMDQQEAIDLAVKHYMSGAYEHETRLPKVGWYEMFHNMIVEKITKLYQAIDSDDFVIPADLLLMFDDDYQQHLAYFRQYLRNVKQVYPHYRQTCQKRDMNKTHALAEAKLA